MKLQIISRLHQANLSAIRQKSHHKQDSTPSIINRLHQDLQVFLNNHEDNSLDIQENKTSSPAAFFAKFHQNCSIKYQEVSPREQKVKRKLQSFLEQIATVQKDKEEPLVSGFTFGFQKMEKAMSLKQKGAQLKQKGMSLKQRGVLLKQRGAQLKEKEAEQKEQYKKNNMNDYYFIHQKPREKVRKFNSLITLRADSLIERKPGCIMKRNLSTKKNNYVGENKQNVSLNSNLKRVASKQKLDSVDQQIYQSKQRIAKIRTQLNEIYRNKTKNKACNHYRLKLF